jgi:hypothetical protein
MIQSITFLYTSFKQFKLILLQELKRTRYLLLSRIQIPIFYVIDSTAFSLAIGDDAFNQLYFLVQLVELSLYSKLTVMLFIRMHCLFQLLFFSYTACFNFIGHI